MVDQRYALAIDAVSRLRADDPGATPDQLADRLIRRCARELAMGGAMSGGAAASPVAGAAVVAATVGADATYSMGRLSEMIMGLGIVYGHDHPSVEERAGWVWAVLGLSEGATVGLTGLAARVGARGGARILSRLPAGTQAAATTRMSRRVMARLSTGRGPWSLAALVPYGIGAGVGAATNAVVARSVGRAAKQYFATDARGRPAMDPGTGRDPVVEDAGEGEIIDAEIVDGPVAEGTKGRVIQDAVLIDRPPVDRGPAPTPPRTPGPPPL